MTEQTPAILLFILVVQGVTLALLGGMLYHLFFRTPRVGSFRIHQQTTRTEEEK
ncbi:hypothetical protein [Bacillus cereus]|uniref:hypothetical protein n=1 Tax=Bacillus cereus TaxID=1396 RepID=UPI0034D3E084